MFPSLQKAACLEHPKAFYSLAHITALPLGIFLKFQIGFYFHFYTFIGTLLDLFSPSVLLTLYQPATYFDCLHLKQTLAQPQFDFSTVYITENVLDCIPF